MSLHECTEEAFRLRMGRHHPNDQGRLHAPPARGCPRERGSETAQCGGHERGGSADGDEDREDGLPMWLDDLGQVAEGLAGRELAKGASGGLEALCVRAGGEIDRGARRMKKVLYSNNSVCEKVVLLLQSTVKFRECACYAPRGSMSRARVFRNVFHSIHVVVKPFFPDSCCPSQIDYF